MKQKGLRELTLALACASPEEQARIINAMSPIDLLNYDAEFEAWAHDSQLPPQSEGWRVWLMQAGRGFGKTRAGAEWVHRLAMGKPGVRIALAGATLHEARSVMVEGVSGADELAKWGEVDGAWMNLQMGFGEDRDRGF